MTRLRTSNNRRRARALKQGGLYTLQRFQFGPSWGETGATTEQIVADIERAMAAAFGTPVATSPASS